MFRNTKKYQVSRKVREEVSTMRLADQLQKLAAAQTRKPKAR